MQAWVDQGRAISVWVGSGWGLNVCLSPTAHGARPDRASLAQGQTVRDPPELGLEPDWDHIELGIRKRQGARVVLEERMVQSSGEGWEG